MLFIGLLMAVAVCIYWDWEAHAPEKQLEGMKQSVSIPLSESIRKYEIREKRVAS